MTETALAFVQDARRRGKLCRPPDWIPELYHPVGSGEAVVPDTLLFYRRGSQDGEGAMLRAFVEADRATMGPRAPGFVHGFKRQRLSACLGGRWRS
ncbi:hypothetical protein [Streptomyces sp. JNUCC 63]